MKSKTTFDRAAFTLIELVVVIIIVAILAAVAVPKFYDRADEAREAATLQSLTTLRSSIELYRVDNTSYPTSLASDIASYLKGPFPETKIGSSASAAVITVTGNSAIASGSVTDTGGWIYNSTTGELRINKTSHFSY